MPAQHVPCSLASAIWGQSGGWIIGDHEMLKAQNTLPFADREHFYIKIKGPRSGKRGRECDTMGFILAFEYVKCMDYYIIILQLLYIIYVVVRILC